jgi:hypothetical protein
MESVTNAPPRKRDEGMLLRRTIDGVNANVRKIETRLGNSEAALKQVNALANNVSSILMPAGSLIDCVPMSYPMTRHPNVPRHWAHGWLPYDGRAASQYWYRVEHIPQLWALYQKHGRNAEDYQEVGGARFIRVRDYTAPIAGLRGHTTKLVFAGNAVPLVFAHTIDGDGNARMEPSSLYA